MRKSCLSIFVGLMALGALLILAGLLYPPLGARLAWQIESGRARLKYWLRPPEKVLLLPEVITATFIPVPTRRATPTLDLNTPTPTLVPTRPPVTLTPTLVPTPLPEKVLLKGVQFEWEAANNCGPANLDMALSFWGWKTTQADTARYLKPNSRDKNVMPYEMIDFVQEKTRLQAVSRVGGDIEMLKSLVAAGFPVIVEKGFEIPKRFEGWMGHYQLIDGYDDVKGVVHVQDSYAGDAHTVTYEEMIHNWRAFNYAYIVVYPPNLEALIFSVLGPQADLNENYQRAAQLATVETQKLSGRDKFFAWFNKGSSLVYLKDFAGAATAYDAAFSTYDLLPEAERPWRMLWYQTGPYFAYFYTQQPQKVIDLADITLKTMADPVLEESYYWRGRARAALGEAEAAIADFRKALEVHPGFIPAVEQLKDLESIP